MIILDTNVLSELTRSLPSPIVLNWARAQNSAGIFTTAVCEAEMLQGVMAMPDGRRRILLARAVEALLNTVLAGRVLPFDRAAARVVGNLAADCQSAGRPVGLADLQIADIARARNADAIATRNGRPFVDSGMLVIDPWQAPTAPPHGP